MFLAVVQVGLQKFMAAQRHMVVPVPAGVEIPPEVGHVSDSARHHDTPQRPQAARGCTLGRDDASVGHYLQLGVVLREALHKVPPQGRRLTIEAERHPQHSRPRVHIEAPHPGLRQCLDEATQRRILGLVVASTLVVRAKVSGEATLHAHGRGTRSLQHSPSNGSCALRVPHQQCSLWPLVLGLLGRTAAVQVDLVVAPGGRLLHCPAEQGRLRSAELQHEGMLRRVKVEQATLILRRAEEALVNQQHLGPQYGPRSDQPHELAEVTMRDIYHWRDMELPWRLRLPRCSSAQTASSQSSIAAELAENQGCRSSRGSRESPSSG
mmetsp:Transcript_35342/g.77283  ORF Transcript_35342/g.77283 Transcript_35342/m.77283 type:complete len:323 (-) Transcript_35342:199-1167(-)